MSDINYTIVRSKRKTLAIEVKLDGTVIVRCPNKCGDVEIANFIVLHRDWLEKTVEKQRKRASERPKEPTPAEIEILKRQAKAYIPARVKELETETGLKPTSVKITSAKTRHGSCSSTNGLCFSYRLMLYPKEAIDYVIVHELCHTVHHNHSKNFWSLVEDIMPDYKQRRNLLR